MPVAGGFLPRQATIRKERYTGMRKWIILGAVLLFVLSAGLLAYPLLSNWYAERHTAEVRTEYLEQVEETDDGTLEQALKAAQAYNEKIRPGVKDAYSKESLQLATKDYANLLNLGGNGVMGYVEIPKINVGLPIYHGTTEETLQNGVGHLLGSSLPVGGESTHAVLSAHSGSTSKLFTDLDRLEVGDTFRLKVLDETLTYQVDQILTVLPYETDALGVVSGKDYCTLSTCTPFGINSHRLLVRGERIETSEPNDTTSESEESVEQAGSTWDAMYLRAVLVGFGVAAIGIVLVLPVRWIIQRRRRR